MTPVLTLTRDHFRVEHIKGLGGGNGGQGMQKRATGVRITHLASGAMAQCADDREQSRNQAKAVARLAENKRFRAWINQRVAEIALGMTVEEAVAKAMDPKNITTEVQEGGRWVPANPDTSISRAEDYR